VLLEGLKKMVGMASIHVLEAEVVDDEDKGDGAPFMSPKARSSVGLVITKGKESLGKEIVGKFASLLEAIDTLVDLEVHPTIVLKLAEIIFIDKFGGDVLKLDTYVLRAVKWCAEIEIGDIKAGKTCIRSGENIVELDLNKVK